MAKDHERSSQPDNTGGPQHQVRLPGFLIDKDLGLGDVLKRATSYVGVKPCGGCQRRADALNRWLAFTRRNSRRGPA